MTKTGKHQTNIAGEWRVGDLLIYTNEKGSKFLGTVEQVGICSDFHFAEWHTGYVKFLPKSDCINITEMQRALGRV